MAFTRDRCVYAVADYAGVSRIQYTVNVRITRAMCSGGVEAASPGYDGKRTRGGAIYSRIGLTGADDLKHERLRWLRDELAFKTMATARGDMMFFTGRLPHPDVSHSHIRSNSAA